MSTQEQSANTTAEQENPFNIPNDASDEAVQAVRNEDTQAAEPEANTSDKPSYEQLQAAANDMHGQYLRLAADFDNFRKRRLNEMEQQRKYGAEHFLSNFLPVLDNFERAQKAITPESDAKEIYAALETMQKQLVQALEQTGLKRCEVIGQPFDPAIHEAVSRMNVPGKEENSVIAEQQAGYMLHDKVLRPAQVIVASSEA
jgi:molecular chaperone GrpE